MLDITGEVCPMTTVRARLAIDALAPGAELIVLLRGVEPRQGVPDAMTALGHRVLAVDDRPDGVTTVRLRRG